MALADGATAGQNADSIRHASSANHLGHTWRIICLSDVTRGCAVTWRGRIGGATFAERRNHVTDTRLLSRVGAWDKRMLRFALCLVPARAAAAMVLIRGRDSAAGVGMRLSFRSASQGKLGAIFGPRCARRLASASKRPGCRAADHGRRATSSGVLLAPCSPCGGRH